MRLKGLRASERYYKLLESSLVKVGLVGASAVLADSLPLDC